MAWFLDSNMYILPGFHITQILSGHKEHLVHAEATAHESQSTPTHGNSPSAHHETSKSDKAAVSLPLLKFQCTLCVSSVTWAYSCTCKLSHANFNPSNPRVLCPTVHGGCFIAAESVHNPTFVILQSVRIVWSTLWHGLKLFTHSNLTHCCSLNRCVMLGLVANVHTMVYAPAPVARLHTHSCHAQKQPPRVVQPVAVSCPVGSTRAMSVATLGSAPGTAEIR